MAPVPLKVKLPVAALASTVMPELTATVPLVTETFPAPVMAMLVREVALFRPLMSKLSVALRFRISEPVRPGAPRLMALTAVRPSFASMVTVSICPPVVAPLRFRLGEPLA